MPSTFYGDGYRDGAAGLPASPPDMSLLKAEYMSGHRAGSNSLPVAERGRFKHREQVGASHDGRYTYWLDPKDLYVYQFGVRENAWQGYLCTVALWESTFSKGRTDTQEAN